MLKPLTITNVEQGETSPALSQLQLEEFAVEEVANKTESPVDGVVAGIVSKKQSLHSPNKDVSNGATT